MKIIIGCEESQAVCMSFREAGHEAYSCDIKPCTGGYPEFHLQGDFFEIIRNKEFDLLIGHPPCTYLTVTGNAWFNIEKYGANAIKRWQDRFDASMFFINMLNCGIKKVCLENPIGFINGIIKPSQIIQPYYFGDEAQKTTCLWLKGLPPLQHNIAENIFDQNVTHVGKGEMITWIDKKGKNKSMPKWYSDAFKLDKEERSTVRSKTFKGIAKAMAEQWG